MSLLTEQERKQLEDDLEQQIGNHAFDAVERAILAKLAGAELPEPVMLMLPNQPETGVYTTDQLTAWGITRYAQGFAAGAAAQLAQEPTALMWQHEETGRVGFLEAWGPVDLFKASNPRLRIVGLLYRRREAK